MRPGIFALAEYLSYFLHRSLSYTCHFTTYLSPSQADFPSSFVISVVLLLLNQGFHKGFYR